jgi:hypothetical protein
MDDEARRLVEHQEIAVLVQDGDREILGLGDRRLRRRDGDLEGLPSFETESGATGATIDEDASSFQESLDPRAAELREGGGDGPVEPITPERRTDGEPMNDPAAPIP